ncbi:MAG: ATP-binding protein [Candidatus Sericytochromatia bacterium]|nr:ATP-binding protein [Candidatus Sericytochromatia bacterium]
MIALITIGLPAAGKSTYARTLEGFEELNLDACREAVSGDAGNQDVTREALALRDARLAAAVAAGRPVVVSDTNLVPAHRKDLVERFRAAGYEVRLVLLDTPYDVCLARNAARARVVPPHAMERMAAALAEHPPERCAGALGVGLVRVSGGAGGRT